MRISSLANAQIAQVPLIFNAFIPAPTVLYGCADQGPIVEGPDILID